MEFCRTAVECRTGRTLPATGDGSIVRSGSGGLPSQFRLQSHSLRHPAVGLRCGDDIGRPPCTARHAGAEVLSIRTRLSTDPDACNPDGSILSIRGFACTSLPRAACPLSRSRPRTHQRQLHRQYAHPCRDASTMLAPMGGWSPSVIDRGAQTGELCSDRPAQPKRNSRQNLQKIFSRTPSLWQPGGVYLP